MVLRGELAELLVKVAPDIYRKYVTKDRKGKAVLYVRLQKALYGLMRAALLFYPKLRKELEQFGFNINPEDPCVANKWITDKAYPEGGHQMTVIWHVDDLLVSCKDTFELTKLQCYLGKIYGPGLTINRGAKHRYLGMDLEFCEDGSLEVGDSATDGYYTAPPRLLSGGGGLTSTAGDYARFAQMLLNGGELDGVRILGRKTIELAMQNSLPEGAFACSPTMGWGLMSGLHLDMAGSLEPVSEGTFTWSGAATTHFFADPSENLIGLIFTQHFPYDEHQLFTRFRISVYQALQ